jgi:MFS transporter, FHS family, L-fucose permease
MASIANQTVITSSEETTTGNGSKYLVPLIILTTLFFMWGFITCMNDLLIPFLKKIFDLTTAQSSLVQFAFFGAYFVVSLFYFIYSINVGDPLAKIGYKNGVIIGLATAAVGCFLFYPAAEIKVFGLFLFALFILAAGITILQMAANPYVALLGHPSTASSRLNMTQAFNSLGTTIAPVIGSKLIFEAVGGREFMTADAVKMPYLFLGGTLLAIAVMIGLSKLPTFTGEKIEKGLGVLKFSHLTLGVIGIFMYVGGEVAIGSFLFQYFEELMGFTEVLAGTYIAYYWGGAMVGRFTGAISLTGLASTQKYSLMAFVTIVTVTAVYWITGDLQTSLIVFGMIAGNTIAFLIGKSAPAKTLAVFAVCVVVLLLVTAFSSGEVALWSVLAIGLFNSIMFPTIFTLAISDLGKYTSQGSSLLVMAIVGGALIPLAMGALIDAIGAQRAFVFPALCYLYIVYYGVSGHKVKQTSA